MATPRIHFSASAGEAIIEINRVSHTCGAITAHDTPQPMVKETSDLTLVTCKNCLNRLKKLSLDK